MCMITYLPAGVPVPVEEITNGGTWNDDGHGWAVAAGIGHMVTGKSMDLCDALDAFIVARKAYPDAPALFHSRWATHGGKNVDNVHPFPVGDDAVLAHNGIMPMRFHPQPGDPRSDTRVYTDLLTQTVSGIWSRRERKRIGKEIGTGNKLVILSVSERFIAPRGFIVNQHLGEWDGYTGAWFSNGDYMARQDRHAAYGGWWNSYLGSENVTYGKPSSARFSEECPVCWSTDKINWSTGVCNACNSCIDCACDLGDCLCYSPASVKSYGTTIHPWDDEERPVERIDGAIVLGRLGGEE